MVTMGSVQGKILEYCNDDRVDTPEEVFSKYP